MAETVETAIYRLQVEGADQIVRLTEHVDGLAVAEEKATASTRTFSQGLQTSIARGDETVRGLENIRKALESYERYAEAGIGTQQQLAAYYEITTRKVEEQSRKLTELAVATENARRAQSEVAAGPGQVVQKAGGTEAYAAQFAAAAKAQDEQIASINRLRAAMNPLEVEQGKIAAQMNIHKQALQEGKISQAEYAAAQDMAAASFKRSSGATTELSEAHKGLNAQGQAAFHSIRSVFEQVALGIPITQALTGQINHLSFAASGEGGLAGAFKQAGGMIGGMLETAKGFLTPANLAIGAIVGMGAAIIGVAAKFASAQKEIERSLIGVGGQSGATAAKINAFAQIGPQQSITGMSPGEKREAGTTFAQAGVDVSKLKDVEDAIRGYAIVAGTDATKATEALAQALGGDLVKAVDELEKVYGALDPALKDTVQAMLLVNDKAGAQQAIMNAVAAANKRALETITPLSAAWRGLINVAEMVAEGWLKILSYKVFETPGQRAAAAAKEAAAAAAAAQQQANQIQNQGKAVVDTYEPEIQQVKKLQQALADLVRAKEAAAAAGKTFDDGGAQQKIQNLITLTQQAQEESVRYQARVAEIAVSWGNVGQAVALQLQAMQNNLQVLEAVGGAAKMAAQYAADYANAIDKGKTATEATALAAANLAAAQAQVNSAAKETLWNLQNQAAAAAAVTDEEKRSAQAMETKNKLIHDGVDAMLAQKVASQQQANAEASAAAAKKRQDDADRTREEEDWKRRSEQAAAHEAEVNRIARLWGNYETKRGMFIDANIMVAAKITGATVSTQSLASAMAEAANEAERIAPAMVAANRGIAEAAERLKQGAFTSFTPGFAPSGARPSGDFAGNQFYPISYSGGGTGRRLSTPTRDPVTGLLLGETDYLTNLGLRDPNADAKFIADAQKNNTDAIDKLTKSTDSLNATNQELLSPYYTQDPRTSHIGFRSQGMALGGYVDVPGSPSSNDNMIATVPVASGERIYIDPMNNRRSTSSGSGTVINISSPITINGNANADQFGRTLYQSNQMLAKQVRNATQ